MKKLAISIITYNRASYIEQGLLEIADVTKQNDIDIYIYDGSSNEDTKNIVNRISELGYNHIFYRCDGALSGNDDPGLSTKNRVRSAFTEPDAEYLWFSGDKAIVDSRTIEHIVEALKLNPDMMVFYPNYEYKEYRDPAEFFKGCAVAFSWFGANITKKAYLDVEEMIEKNKDIYGFSIQSGYLNALDKEDFLGITLPSVVLMHYGKSSGSETVSDMWPSWIGGWYTLLTKHFPKRLERIKKDVMPVYDKETTFFSGAELIRQRLEGQFNIFTVLKYFKQAKEIVQLPISKVISISLMPKGILKMYRGAVDYDVKILDAKKEEHYKWLLFEMLREHRKGNTIAGYCKKHGYKNVAIYGAFSLSEAIKDDLDAGGINVPRFYDINKSGSYYDIPCVKPDVFSDDLDAIIIAATYSEDEIKEFLHSKTNIPVMGLDDVLTELKYDYLEEANKLRLTDK